MVATTIDHALERLIDLATPARGARARQAVTEALLGATGQILLPRMGGGRVAAFEMSLATGDSISMHDALATLVRGRAVTADDALGVTRDPAGLRAKLAS